MPNCGLMNNKVPAYTRKKHRNDNIFIYDMKLLGLYSRKKNPSKNEVQSQNSLHFKNVILFELSNHSICIFDS